MKTTESHPYKHIGWACFLLEQGLGVYYYIQNISILLNKIEIEDEVVK